MTIIVLMFVVLMGAVLEATLPTFAWLGYVPVPIMQAIVIYYALIHSRARAIAAALFSGFMTDALSPMPLGYMSFCYCIVALIIYEIRETLLVRQWTIHVLLGACAHVGVTLALFILLAKDDLIHTGPLWFLAKIMGATITGAVTMPLVFHALQLFEQTVGVMEAREI